jgi:serine/threonine protein kinase
MNNVLSKLFNNQLELMNHIGNENNASVYDGVYNNNSKMTNVIIKMIPRKDIKYIDQMLIEIGFLKYLSGFKTSLQYINVCYSIKLSSEYLIIVLEKPNGRTLKDIIENYKFSNWDEYYKFIKVIMFRLLLAINYIHSKGVAHRGLNPETIYIDYVDGFVNQLKISDFAVSCGNYESINYENQRKKTKGSSQSSKTQKKTIYNRVCETINLDINPPENFKLSKLIARIKQLSTNQTRESIYLYLAKKADVWSLGILFWKLLNRKSLDESPLDLKFPTNYNQNLSWKTLPIDINNKSVLGDINGKDNFDIMNAFFKIVVDLMLNKIPSRGKSDEILEKFITTNKYYYIDKDS